MTDLCDVKIPGDFYVLNDDKSIRPAENVGELANQMSILNPVQRATSVHPYYISTAFLSVPHGHIGGKPVLFETAVFKKNSLSDMLICVRAVSFESAVINHGNIVSKTDKSRNWLLRLIWPINHIIIRKYRSIAPSSGSAL